MTNRFVRRVLAFRRGIRRQIFLHAIRLFRVQDESERVARGFALGLIVNFFPTFGLGVLVSGLFARLLGGNTLAGIIGGSILTFCWPALFYLNMQVGGLLFPSPIPVDDVQDVTPAIVGALVWGKTFAGGAILNSIVLGGAVYLLIRVLYERVRPGALGWFRRLARADGKLSEA